MNTSDAEQREIERRYRVQCKRLYQLSKADGFDELMNFLEEERKYIVARPDGGLDGAINFYSAKVWQDAVEHIADLLKQKIKDGLALSGEQDDTYAPPIPGDSENGQERHWRDGSGPGPRRA